MGVSSNGGVSAFSHRYTSQRISQVAERNQRPLVDGCSILACLAAIPIVIPLMIVMGASFGAVIIIGAALIVGAPLAAMIVALKPSAAQKEADARYERQWYCEQCGTLFEREDERP